MSKIGFDMDGVLLPDYNKIVGLGDREFFLQTLYAKPIFNPIGEFDIVTARLEIWRDITEEWLQQLITYPKNVFMRADEDTETPAEFKYKIAIQQKYTHFIESDPIVCREMSQLNQKHTTYLSIIHFDKFISESFY